MAVKYPDAPMWRCLAGYYLRIKGMDAEALIEFLKAWDKPVSKVNQHWETILKAQIDAIQVCSNFGQMISDAESAVSKNPDDLIIWQYILGYGYLHEGRYEDAIKELEASVKLLASGTNSCSKDGLVWRTMKYVLGYAYEQDKQYSRALAAYQEVVKVYPQYWRSQYGIFICLSKQNKLDEASIYINNVINNQPAIRECLRELVRNYLLNEE